MTAFVDVLRFFDVRKADWDVQLSQTAALRNIKDCHADAAGQKDAPRLRHIVFELRGSEHGGDAHKIGKRVRNNGIRRFFIGIYGVQQQTADIKCAFFRFHMPSSYVKSPE